MSSTQTPPPTTPPDQAKTSSELRAEVEQARARLAGTVGEIAGVIDDTRTELVRRVKRTAPVAAGAVASYVAFKLLRRHRRQ
jgi:hypothetical protein